jgi:hypothetical protein
MGEEYLTGNNYIVSINQAPINLTFHLGSNGMLFSIQSDGTIEKGPAFTTDDVASLQFWEILSKSYPNFLKKTDK